MVAFLAQLQSSTRVIGTDRLVVRRGNNTEHPLTMQIQLSEYAIADQATRRELAQAEAKKAAERRRTAPKAAENGNGEKTP